MTAHENNGSPIKVFAWWTWLRGTRRFGALKSVLVKPALSAAATFVITAVVVGLLRDPIDHSLVPKLLEYMHQEQALHLYDITTSGTYKDPDQTYAVFMPSSGTSRSGRMIERLDGGLNPAYDYVVSGSEQAGILTLSFRPYASEKIGGGTFVGDGNRKVILWVSSRGWHTKRESRAS
jgi:hypothetical protein